MRLPQPGDDDLRSIGEAVTIGVGEPLRGCVTYTIPSGPSAMNRMPGRSFAK